MEKYELLKDLRYVGVDGVVNTLYSGTKFTEAQFMLFIPLLSEGDCAKKKEWFKLEEDEKNYEASYLAYNGVKLHRVYIDTYNLVDTVRLVEYLNKNVCPYVSSL